MLKCILEDIQKYVIKKYFQIVLLVSMFFMQLLNNGYKRLKKLLYVFFTHYIDSNFLLYVDDLFKIKFYIKNSIHYYYILLIIQSSKN
jgi:hypothetical protein